MEITILDGGMGQELLSRSSSRPTGLWSARFLMDAPDLVRSVHADYLAAGADVITTNSYVLHRDRLAPFGVEDQFETLHGVACRLAMEARDAHGSGLIAGSLGPNAGSYRPDLSLPEARAAEVFAEMARLQAPYVDLLLLETMSSIEQARGAVMGAQTAGLPVWLAVTVDDNDGTRLRSGEKISMLPELCKEMTLDTLLVNCSIPEAVTQAVTELTGCGLRIGAYANGFTRITDAFLDPGATVDVLQKRLDMDPETYAGFAADWISRGVGIVGGCCEVGPAHIALMAKQLKPGLNIQT
ncbi:MAG: homocysteine S-methyltransferase family protein [Desulfotignum sp.]|nr:homocysteine S-methyltransferase family protein [Desulfotignum sp.]MCF8089276.1 homocysteine S-methyltransferase family protein [Desulfotignum sp.]MCF8137569.1 homocysteine S-methyltransferase family protein [Desulfotignum sp.]